MSKTQRWITLMLALVAVVLVGWSLADGDSDDMRKKPEGVQPTYTSQSSNTVVYNPQGGLSYKLVSDTVTWFSDESVSWFDKPTMTTYDEKKTPTWLVKADKARLTKEKMLYLYGHVVVNSLTNDAQLEQIKTDNAIVNLITQDVTSDDQVTLYGRSFNSTGMKMRGNLRKKSAELLEKVKTSYEIQNNKQP